MAGPTQLHRHVAVGTPLGDDVLLLTGMTGSEALSRPFQYDLELLSTQRDIPLESLLGQNITLRLEHPAGTRYFNGYASRFVQAGFSEDLARYQATVVPWLWFLTRQADCRIFQNKSVPDIVQEVFRGHGFSDFEVRLEGTYQPWEFCVQYRETDFNFVGRLMEQVGIYYYFRHENGRHILVLCDSPAAHDPYPAYETVLYRGPGQAYVGQEHIWSWSHQKQVQPGTYVLGDYDFISPRKDLRAELRMPPQPDHANSGFEMYDWPGEYTDHGVGSNYARIRMEELQARHETVSGQANARGIGVGYRFALAEFPRTDQNRAWLVTGANYKIQCDVYETAGPGGAGTLFTCDFQGIDEARTFRPARQTPRPVVQGPQTAVVVGPQGEEIYTDEHGRVKVQFHWDRYGKANESSSCWIRVSQPWAGRKWGAVFLPRIGQEVIVEFLEGDPDKPIVTGRVYNGIQMPPYELPANKTRSTIKSMTTPGGGGFNEIRLEDKKGQEQIFIHAQKDKDVRVTNDTREWVGNDRHLVVKGDQLETVEGDKHQAVTGDRNEKVDGTISTQVGQDQQEKVGGNHALDAGMEIHLKAGMNVVIEAGMSITLKAGGGFIVVGPSGVTISGTPVLINSGGSAGSGSGASPDSPQSPMDADKAQAGQREEPAKPPMPPVPTQFGPSATVLKQASLDGTPFVERC